MKSWKEYPTLYKTIQNLEYEFKQLKLRASNTGEEGLLRIKQNFPYYDMLDYIMGYRYSVNPDLMEIKSSSFLPIKDCSVKSSESSTPTPPPPPPPTGSTSSDSEHEPEPHCERNGARPAAGRVTKRASTSGKRGKGKRRKVQEDESDGFKEMWERSQQQESEGFEKCIEMIERTQKLQMEQINAIVSGFKDLFKDLLQK